MKPHHRELLAFLRSVGARHVRIRHHGSPHPRIAFSYEAGTSSSSFRERQAIIAASQIKSRRCGAN
jgi:hypothetical protein